jgi:hypothetical protein
MEASTVFAGASVVTTGRVLQFIAHPFGKFTSKEWVSRNSLVKMSGKMRRETGILKYVVYIIKNAITGRGD